MLSDVDAARVHFTTADRKSHHEFFCTASVLAILYLPMDVAMASSYGALQHAPATMAPGKFAEGDASTPVDDDNQASAPEAPSADQPSSQESPTEQAEPEPASDDEPEAVGAGEIAEGEEDEPAALDEGEDEDEDAVQ